MSEQIVVQDDQKMIERIHDLPGQLEKAWASAWTKNLSITSGDFDRILIAGMGGSGISGALAKELLLDSPISIDTWADYGLPGFVNDKTLFIAVSFSGETEETLDAAKKAKEKNARLVAITKGGKLADFVTAEGGLVLSVDYDSSPREAIGWLYGSLLVLLTKLGVSSLTEEKYFASLKELTDVVKQKKFPVHAQQIAVALTNRIPLIMSQSPLTAVAHRWVTQINENAKMFAFSPALPELCHNTIVGLDFAVTEKLAAIFLDSESAFSRNTLRKNIIQKIFEQKGIPFTPLTLRTKSLLAEQWLFIYLGDLVSYYLAGINDVDPSPIESINFLKEELKKA